MTVDPDDFAVELQHILRSYGTAMNLAVDEAVDSVAKKAKAKLNHTSPKRTGRYAKGWAIKKDKKGSVVVYNKHYQLTHLLEKGHRTRYATGKKIYGKKSIVMAQPHIAPVADMVQEELPAEINEKLKL